MSAGIRNDKKKQKKRKSKASTKKKKSKKEKKNKKDSGSLVHSDFNICESNSGSECWFAQL